MLQKSVEEILGKCGDTMADISHGLMINFGLALLQGRGEMR